MAPHSRSRGSRKTKDPFREATQNIRKNTHRVPAKRGAPYHNHKHGKKAFKGGARSSIPMSAKQPLHNQKRKQGRRPATTQMQQHNAMRVDTSAPNNSTSYAQALPHLNDQPPYSSNAFTPSYPNNVTQAPRLLRHRQTSVVLNGEELDRGLPAASNQPSRIQSLVPQQQSISNTSAMEVENPASQVDIPNTEASAPHEHVPTARIPTQPFTWQQQLTSEQIESIVAQIQAAPQNQSGLNLPSEFVHSMEVQLGKVIKDAMMRDMYMRRPNGDYVPMRDFIEGLQTRGTVSPSDRKSAFEKFNDTPTAGDHHPSPDISINSITPTLNDKSVHQEPRTTTNLPDQYVQSTSPETPYIKMEVDEEETITLSSGHRLAKTYEQVLGGVQTNARAAGRQYRHFESQGKNGPAQNALVECKYWSALARRGERALEERDRGNPNWEQLFELVASEDARGGPLKGAPQEVITLMAFEGGRIPPQMEGEQANERPHHHSNGKPQLSRGARTNSRQPSRRPLHNPPNRTRVRRVGGKYKKKQGHPHPDNVMQHLPPRPPQSVHDPNGRRLIPYGDIDMMS